MEQEVLGPDAHLAVTQLPWEDTMLPRRPPLLFFGDPLPEAQPGVANKAGFP